MEKEKPTKCFICGKQLERTKEWKQDYCKKHENHQMAGLSSSTDWGMIMESLETGHPSPSRELPNVTEFNLSPYMQLNFR
jgi:hypothetical protein